MGMTSFVRHLVGSHPLKVDIAIIGAARTAPTDQLRMMPRRRLTVARR